MQWNIQCGYDTWITHMSLRLHMTKEGFDFFKFNGKVKLPYSRFEERNDRSFYNRLYTKNLRPGDILLANTVVNPVLWIGDIISDEGYDRYYDWVSRRDALTYNFESDINKFRDKPFDNLEVKDGQLPFIISQFLGNRISIETVCIFVWKTKTLQYLKNSLTNHIMAPDVLLRIEKYTPFVEFDETKISDILSKRFGSSKKRS